MCIDMVDRKINDSAAVYNEQKHTVFENHNN